MLKNFFRKKNKKEPNVKPEVDNLELDEDLKVIAEYMLKKEKRTPDAVNLSIYNRERFARWNRNADIKKEFAYFIKNGKYPDKPVEVCGWTAKKLFEEYSARYQNFLKGRILHVILSTLTNFLITYCIIG